MAGTHEKPNKKERNLTVAEGGKAWGLTPEEVGYQRKKTAEEIYSVA